MITYLLIEDRKNMWQEYQSILAEQCPDLQPHPNNKFFDSFKKIEDNIYQAILSSNVDLIISDISLSYDTKDKSTYISQLLRNVVKRLNDKKHRVLARKGIGLILVTLFPKDNLSIILAEDLSFLGDHFRHWSFFESEHFEEKIEEKLQKFKDHFIETPVGWYREDLLENYRHSMAINQFNFYLANQRLIRGQDIIALTQNEVTYLHNGQIVQNTHNEDLQSFMEKTGTYRICDGRSLEEKKSFHRIKESIYFLHIRNRKPLTLINLEHAWRIERLNRGRRLTLIVDDVRVGYNCSFPILDDFLDTSKFPRIL